MPWVDLVSPSLVPLNLNRKAEINRSKCTELIDKTGNPNFSYIWLAASSAVNSDTNTSIWSAGFSHITLVRDAPRNTGAPAHLIDGTRGTHLTLRATMNGVKKPFGMHISLPADSASMAQHFLVIVPTNVSDTIAAKQFWVDLTNIFTKHCKCKAEYVHFTCRSDSELTLCSFAKASWKKFLEDLKTDVVNILTEYAKVLKKLEETGQKMN